MLALAKAIAMYPAGLVHVGPFVEKLDWLPCQRRIAAIIVNNAWSMVPRNSQARDREPIRSPIRPIKAPRRNARMEANDWRSTMRKWGPGVCWREKSLAKASASCSHDGCSIFRRWFMMHELAHFNGIPLWKDWKYSRRRSNISMNRNDALSGNRTTLRQRWMWRNPLNRVSLSERLQTKWYRTTYTKPVMKQYAARGPLAWSGSTSVHRYRLSRSIVEYFGATVSMDELPSSDAACACLPMTCKWPPQRKPEWSEWSGRFHDCGS